MADGNRLDVFFVHPSRGKRMVHGAATREKLGYIGYGSFISNVHESDVAARPQEFICGRCQKPFTVIRDTAHCRTCFPPAQRPQPQLGQMRPRPASDRVSPPNRQQAHPNFQNQPDPWQDQQQGYNPNVGFNQQAQAQALPPAPPRQAQASPVFNPPPPEPPPPPAPTGSMDNPTAAVAAAKQQKAQSFGIPIMEPGEIGPPPNLSHPVPEQPASPMAQVRIAELDFGRSVNNRHKELLANSGVNTLYDAMKLGNDGLQNISGIGAGVSSAIMTEVDKRLAA